MNVPHIVQCRSLHAYYQAAIQYLTDRSGIPILSISDNPHFPIGGQELPIVSYKNKEGLKAPSLDSFLPPSSSIQDMEVVVTVDSDIVCPLAKFYAATFGRTLILVERLENVAHRVERESPRSLLLICSPELLEEHALVSLQICLEGHSIPWGILTARTPAALTSLVARNIIARATPQKLPGCSYLYGVDYSLTSACDGSELTYNRKAFDNIDSTVLSRTYSYTNVFSHGHDDHIFLGPYPLIDEPGRTEEAFPLTQLSTRVFFANTCMSLKIARSSAFSRGRIGLKLLESDICAYIGTTRVKEGKVVENFLFSALARSGYSLGQITLLLNKAASAFGLDRSPFLLIGDPELALFTWSEVAKVTLTDAPEQLCISDVNSHLVEVTWPSNHSYTKLQPASALTIEATTSTAVSYVLLAEPSRTRLLLFGSQRLQCSELRLQMVNMADFGMRIRRLENALDEAVHESPLKILPQGLDGKIAEMRRELVNIGRWSTKLSYSGDIAKRLAERLAKGEIELERMQIAVLNSLVERISSGKERYWEQYGNILTLSRSEFSSDPCLHCGGSILQRWLSMLGQGEVRKMVICSYCGILYDGPVNSSIKVHLVSPSVVPLHTSTQAVEIHNTGVETACGCHMACCEWNFDNDDVADVSLGQHTFHLQPGEKCLVPLELHVKQYGKYFLKHFLLDGLRVLHTSRPLWCQDS